MQYLMYNKTQLAKDNSCVNTMHHKQHTSHQQQRRRTNDMPTAALVKTPERLDAYTVGAGAVLPLHAVHRDAAAIPQHLSGIVQRLAQELLLADLRVDVCPSASANVLNMACDTTIT